MDRDALLVYLHDLRDLEAAKYQIEKMRKNNISKYNSATKKFQSDIKEISISNYMKKPDFPSVFETIFGSVTVITIGLCIAIVIGVIAAVALRALFHIDIMITTIVMIVLSSIFVVIVICTAFSEYVTYIRDMRDVKKHNKEEKKRLEFTVPAIINEKKEMQKKIVYDMKLIEQQLRKEAQKVSDLLDEAYSLNILASQYRNLSAVYYIYEYMSTSQATLEETFMHAHMENGFQRIEKKLDIIIEQNEKIIFTNRKIEANTAKIVEQNMDMLNKLQRSLELQQSTEQNTLEAAQYASICAIYSKVNAFYSTANFLSKQL